MNLRSLQIISWVNLHLDNIQIVINKSLLKKGKIKEIMV